MFFLPSNSKQTLYTQNTTAQKYWIHVTLDCKDIDFEKSISLPHFINVSNPEYVENLFENIIFQKNKNTISDKLEQKSYILNLIAYYFKNAGYVRPIINYDNCIANVLSYIDENFTKHLNVVKLSKMCNFHPNYFIRRFKSVTGLTPIAYINNRRISAAQKFLLEENYTISDVCYKVGFNSLQYFSRKFKAETGFYPNEYRGNSIFKHSKK